MSELQGTLAWSSLVSIGMERMDAGNNEACRTNQ